MHLWCVPLYPDIQVGVNQLTQGNLKIIALEINAITQYKNDLIIDME